MSEEETASSIGVFVECMQRCWAQDPDDRPTFAVVFAELDRLNESQRAASHSGDRRHGSGKRDSGKGR